MITFLEGTLVEKSPTRVVLNVGGVGYEVFIPLSTYDRLPDEDMTCRLMTHDHVREDNHALYGFGSSGERQMFEMLLAVSGIGPRTAMSALSGLSVREIKRAVVEGDVKRLGSISGVGKKTAERIVVDLKHKLSEGEALESVAPMPDLSAEDIRTRDAILALISLGYKQADAQKMAIQAMGKMKGAPSVEEIVRRALVAS